MHTLNCCCCFMWTRARITFAEWFSLWLHLLFEWKFSFHFITYCKIPKLHIKYIFFLLSFQFIKQYYLLFVLPFSKPNVYVLSSELWPNLRNEKPIRMREPMRSKKNAEETKTKNEIRKRREEKRNVKNASHPEHWHRKKKKISNIPQSMPQMNVLFSLYSWYKKKNGTKKETAQKIQNMHIVPIRRISDLSCMKESPVPGLRNAIKQRENKRMKHFSSYIDVTFGWLSSSEYLLFSIVTR